MKEIGGKRSSVRAQQMHWNKPNQVSKELPDIEKLNQHSTTERLCMLLAELIS